MKKFVTLELGRFHPSFYKKAQFKPFKTLQKKKKLLLLTKNWTQESQYQASR